jgi:large subunit ribosomal protein L32e
MNTKKKPQFRRTQGAMYTRLKGKGWRRPTGKHNKIGDNKKGKGEVPRIGYGANREMRHLHPCGLDDILISNVKNIEGLNSERHAARISASIGKRKKAVLLEELEKRKIKVLNPGVKK